MAGEGGGGGKEEEKEQRTTNTQNQKRAILLGVRPEEKCQKIFFRVEGLNSC